MKELHQILYEQSGFPVLQNRLFATREASQRCKKGEICLVQDGKTGLVHNIEFDQSVLEYDSNYHNEQEYSLAFKQHLAFVADLVERDLGDIGLVEIGCGKGYFLELLASRGCEIHGFDPTYEGENRSIRKAYFDITELLQAKGVVLRHVLEHIPDPINFLQQIRVANGNRGLIYIEVPCFEWICQNRAWFDIFYEHVNYFRLEDFHRIFSKVLSSGRLFGNQYLYCIAELESLRASPLEGWTRIVLPPDFSPPEGSLSRSNNRPANHREAVWGCASKGVIFALLRNRAGNPLDLAIDINPKKQGLYLPVSGIQVLPPEIGLSQLPLGSTIFVMNPMYLEEVKSLGGPNYIYVTFSHIDADA